MGIRVIAGGHRHRALHHGRAVLRARQGAALRAGADPLHAFLTGYHTGLLVTVGLLAAGVAVSYLTLRPRPAAAEGQPGAAVPRLSTADELALVEE